MKDICRKIKNLYKEIANDKNKGAKITGRHNDRERERKSFSFTSSKKKE